jgi:hypothetical protein
MIASSFKAIFAVSPIFALTVLGLGHLQPILAVLADPLAEFEAILI